MPLGPATAASHGDARFLTPQHRARCLGLQPLTAGDRLRQRLASAAARILGASFVHFIGALRAIGQDQHLVASDLQEAAADGHGLFGTATFDAHYARVERGQQRRVPRQDAHHTFGAWRNHHVHGIVREDFALGGHDLHP